MADSERFSKPTATHYSPWIFLLILTSRIHGGCTIWYGNIPTDDRFSYTVAITIIQPEKCSFCSGAIISSQHILTAAHCGYCVDDPKKYHVLVQDASIAKGTEIYAVKAIHRHPHYKHGGDKFDFCKQFLAYCILRHRPDLQSNNDIAVMKLAKEMPVGGSVKKISLPLPAPLSYPTVCNLSGFGRTEKKLQNGKYVSGFRWAELTIIDPEECQQKEIHLITDDILCTDDKVSRPGHGDSGGPLVCGSAVYGVMSLGAHDLGHVTIFTNVVNYLKFIFDAIRQD